MSVRTRALRQVVWWAGRPPALVSREEVEEEKARLRAIDARPIKKVAEAKQRKRKRLQACPVCLPRLRLCLTARAMSGAAAARCSVVSVCVTKKVAEGGERKRKRLQARQFLRLTGSPVT